MAGYVIARVQVDDPEAYKKYTAKTPGVIAQYGGKFIVRGGEVQSVEGEPEERRVVVIEFEDMEAARKFYFSDDYQAIIPLRQAASSGQVFLVDGA